MPVTIDDKVVFEIMERLLSFSKNELSAPLNDAANQLKWQLSRNFALGQNSNGDKYEYVTKLTMDLPIKRTGEFKDGRLRGDVNASQIGMVATGRTRDSFVSKKISDTEFVIGFDDPRTSLILESNTRNTGNVAKPRRDPAGLSERNPSEKELDIVVDEIEKALERLLGGL